MFRDSDHRNEYIQRLADIIGAAMIHSSGMCSEAILEGRVGLNKMSDTELTELGTDCWGVMP